MIIRPFLTLWLCPLALSVLAFSASVVKSDNDLTPDTVVAQIDGTKVTLGELESKRADSLYQARNAYYQAERNALVDLINDYLLDKRAQKEGVTVAQLIDRHVKSTLPKDPSEEALRVYYEGLNSPEPFEVMRPRILDHIRQIRFDKAKAAYIESLQTQAKLAITLPPPRADISLKDTPVLGSQTAPVVFVEYADYECPVCQQVAPTLLKLETAYKGKVQFAFKDTPLPMHAHAQKAAEAARCAGAQGKYWEYHDMLFSTEKLELPDLKDHARKLNLDTAAFDKCLDSGDQAAVVKAQYDDAMKLGVTGTPTFFINGRVLSGALPYEKFRAAIDEELGTAQPRSSNKETNTASR